jgi:hypothetical protein
MSDCLQATCGTKYEHKHGHSCNDDCQACNGDVVILKNLPSTKIEKEH